MLEVCSPRMVLVGYGGWCLALLGAFGTNKWGHTLVIQRISFKGTVEP